MRISDWSSDVCSSDLALQHDELAGLGGQAAKALVEILDAVVLEADDVGIAEIAAVVDRGMAVGVEDDVIALGAERRHHAEIGLIAGREDDGVIGAIEFLQRVLALPLALTGAVQPAAAGRSEEHTSEL